MMNKKILYNQILVARYLNEKMGELLTGETWTANTFEKLREQNEELQDILIAMGIDLESPIDQKEMNHE